MKHFKPMNKAAQAARPAADESELQQLDVVGMQLPLGCAPTFDPGWEVDPFGGLNNL